MSADFRPRYASRASIIAGRTGKRQYAGWGGRHPDCLSGRSAGVIQPVRLNWLLCQMSDGIKLHEKISPLCRGVFPLRFSDDAIGVLFAAIDAVSITAASLAASLLYNAFAYNEAAIT
jgi:hypothetical protein